MKKLFLTLLLIGTAVLLKAQQNKPLSADSALTKLVTHFPYVAKPAQQSFQPQLNIANTLKELAAKSLFAENEIKDRMPVAKLEEYSKMPVVKLEGNDNMPVARIGAADPASTNQSDKSSAKTPW